MNAHTREAPAPTHTLALATAGMMLALAYTATLPPAIVACVPLASAAVAAWRVDR